MADGSRFCGTCGNKLSEAASPNVGSTAPSNLSTVESVSESERLELVSLPRIDTSRFSEKLLNKEFKEYEGDLVYKMDYSRYSCTCSDWITNRSSYPETDVRRLCKHLTRKLPGKLKDDFFRLSRILTEAYTVDGVPIWLKIGCYKIDEKYVILVRNSDRPWIDVITIPRYERKTNPYSMFGFNVEEKRWSYGEGPKNARVLRELIDSWQ